MIHLIFLMEKVYLVDKKACHFALNDDKTCASISICILHDWQKEWLVGMKQVGDEEKNDERKKSKEHGKRE